MSEMVERVARAMCDAEGQADFDCRLSYVRDRYRRRARAAIAAMREPDKEMIVQGDVTLEDCMDSDFDSDCDGNRTEYRYLMGGSATKTWRAMIDEALR